MMGKIQAIQAKNSAKKRSVFLMLSRVFKPLSSVNQGLFSGVFGGLCLSFALASPAVMWAERPFKPHSPGLLRLGETPLGRPLGAKKRADCRGVFVARTPDQQLRAYPGRSRSQALLISQGERALNRVINQKEADILEEAHLIGQGKPGKDGSPAKKGNYTPAQLRAKVRILKKAFPSPEERGRLIRDGAVGEDEAAGTPEEEAKLSSAQGFQRLEELRQKSAALEENAERLAFLSEELLAESEEVMNRLSIQQITFLGQSIGVLRRSLPFSFVSKDRKMIEELRVSLGMDRDQYVVEMMSQIALKIAAGDFAETEPFLWFKRLLEEIEMETAYLSPKHFPRLHFGHRIGLVQSIDSFRRGFSFFFASKERKMIEELRVSLSMDIGHFQKDLRHHITETNSRIETLNG